MNKSTSLPRLTLLLKQHQPSTTMPTKSRPASVTDEVSTGAAEAGDSVTVNYVVHLPTVPF
jgi:hypothetical protein